MPCPTSLDIDDAAPAWLRVAAQDRFDRFRMSTRCVAAIRMDAPKVLAAEEEGAGALFEWQTLTILLRSGVDPAIQEATLAHEFCHGCMYAPHPPDLSGRDRFSLSRLHEETRDWFVAWYDGPLFRDVTEEQKVQLLRAEVFANACEVGFFGAAAGAHFGRQVAPEAAADLDVVVQMAADSVLEDVEVHTLVEEPVALELPDQAYPLGEVPLRPVGLDDGRLQVEARVSTRSNAWVAGPAVLFGGPLPSGWPPGRTHRGVEPTLPVAPGDRFGLSPWSGDGHPKRRARPWPVTWGRWTIALWTARMSEVDPAALGIIATDGEAIHLIALPEVSRRDLHLAAAGDALALLAFTKDGAMAYHLEGFLD